MDKILQTALSLEQLLRTFYVYIQSVKQNILVTFSINVN